MKKNIEIIIKEKDRNHPIKRIQKVSAGYAFNYLIPNKKAEISTKGKIKHIHMLNNSLSKKKHQILRQNHQTRFELEKIRRIHIRKKHSPNKQIFGSITENDIINKLFKLTGNKLDKKQVIITSMKQINIHKCTIKLNDNSSFNIALCILPNIV